MALEHETHVIIETLRAAERWVPYLALIPVPQLVLLHIGGLILRLSISRFS